MIYLLDAQVIIFFFKAQCSLELSKIAKSTPCAIAEAVQDELTPAKRAGQQIKAWLPTSGLRIEPIFVGGEADQVLGRLESATNIRRGRGERASVALAATRPELCFVAMDKGALWIALRELWSTSARRMGLQVFLRRAVDEGHLHIDAAQAVLGASGQIMPTWWPGWVKDRC